jgi:hypothetical protein
LLLEDDNLAGLLMTLQDDVLCGFVLGRLLDRHLVILKLLALLVLFVLIREDG